MLVFLWSLPDSGAFSLPDPSVGRQPGGTVRLPSRLLSASVFVLSVLQTGFTLVYQLTSDVFSLFSGIIMFLFLFFPLFKKNVSWVSCPKCNAGQKLVINCCGLRAGLNNVRHSHLQG